MDGEASVRPGRDVDRPAGAPDDASHECQTHPTPHPVHRGLCRVTVCEHAFGVRRWHARPGVDHLQGDVDVVREVDRDGSRRVGGRDGLDGVVDEVSKDGRQRECQRLRRIEVGLLGDDELDAVFVRDRLLGHEQGRERRRRDPRAECLGRGEVVLSEEGEVAARLLVFPEIEQACEDVQPVDELVLLGPERVGQAADGVHPPDEALELGAVLESRDAAGVPAGDHRGPLVDDEQGVVGDDAVIRARDLPGQHAAEPARRQQVGQPTDTGSSTDFLTQYLTTKNGINPADTTRRGVGAGATFIAAMKQKAIDCGMTTEPTVSKVLSDGTGFILLDMRTAEGSRSALGGTYPATSLYMTTDYVNAHKDVVQKLVNAYVSTLKWIQGHTGDQIAAMMPADYYAGVGKAAYAKALDSEKGIFNPTGIMPPDGPKTALAVLSAFNPAVKGKAIDLAKTYTDQFVQAATPVA